jgi:hypothetical protein
MQNMIKGVHLPKLALLGTGAILIMAFQNCSNAMSFAQDGLVAKAEDRSEDLLDEVVGLPDDRAPGTGGGSREPVVDDCDEERRDGLKGRKKRRSSQAVASSQVLCVLAGPKQTVKLGYLEDNGDVRTVCVSRRACLEIASREFEVKGAIEAPDFCGGRDGGGATTKVALTDYELEEMVALRALARSSSH